VRVDVWKCEVKWRSSIFFWIGTMLEPGGDRWIMNYEMRKSTAEPQEKLRMAVLRGKILGKHGSCLSNSITVIST
jgi:hypothetical protein